MGNILICVNKNKMERALSELLKSIASKRNLDLDIASKFFDSCILTTSIKLNMNYKDVYNIKYKEKFLFSQDSSGPNRTSWKIIYLITMETFQLRLHPVSQQ